MKGVLVFVLFMCLFTTSLFLCFSYIYLDDLRLDQDVVVMVLYASKKYLLPGLTERCIHFLNQNLHVSNATLILDMALLFEEKKLAEKCITLIKINTKDALEVDSFLDVRLDTLDYILGMDALSWEESSLFLRCIEWAKRQCDCVGVKPTGIEIRKVLGKSLFKINFSNIRGPVFIKHVSPLKILSEREELKFLRHLTVKYDSDADDCTDDMSDNRVAASPPKGFACSRMLRQIFDVSFNHRKEVVTKANEHFMFQLTLHSQFSFVIDSLELCSVAEYPYSGCRIMMVQPRLVVNNQPIQANFKDVIRKCDPEVMKSRRRLVMEEKAVILEGENQIDVSFKIYSDHGSGVNVCGVIKVLKGSKMQGKDKDLVVPLEIESRDGGNQIPVYGITYRLNRDGTLL